MTNEVPRLRASDSERHRILDLLQQAMANGQLDFAECDERSRQVMAATYRDELLVPLNDLIPHPEQALGKEVAPLETALPVQPRSSLASLRQVSPGARGDSFSLSLMSGTEKKGQWTVAKNHTSISVMGGTSLDLREAFLCADHITIDAYAIMGGMEIVVPEDVRVISTGFALMGGFGVIDSNEVTVKQDQLPADAPTISVTGFALMGGVDIRRKARHER